MSKTARILGISRHHVRRVREGPVEDRSRRPHHSPRKTEHALEKFIVKVANDTGFRYRRLFLHLHKKYGLKISENTIKAILRSFNWTGSICLIRSPCLRKYMSI